MKTLSLRRLVLALVAPFLLAVASAFAAEPASTPAPTAQAPVETLSATRARINLNGLWRFMPATRGAAEQPTDDWGLMPVPGSWRTGEWSMGMQPLSGVLVKGTGENWQDLGRELARGWYERTFDVPKDWDNKAILLELRRVSTDATVWVNGQDCGRVAWPYGSVDITKAVKPGQKATVRILVVATPDAGEVINWMGNQANANSKSRAKLRSMGLIGEVFLNARPLGPVVTDVFAQPSTRKKQLTLELQIEGVTQAGEVALTARMMTPDGKAEKTFTAKTKVEAKPHQTVRVTFPWADPRLWDLGQPNLYVARVALKGAGLDDEYPQRFGFREFWIEGRDFFLNGSKIRLRPTLAATGAREGGDPVSIDGIIQGMLKAGFNCAQLWPNNHDERSVPMAHRELWCERADELGFLMIGPALSMNGYINDSSYNYIWETAGKKEQYRERMTAEMLRYRNFPSVILWGTSGNLFNHDADQNPRWLGRKDFLPPQMESPKRKGGDEALAMIRQADPTRPVFTHAGNRVGDVFTVNHYLNLIPLQEREEWLSAYVEDGNVPYIGIEFGNPLDADMMRGRAAYGFAMTSEPLMTEHVAAYLGRAAYEGETRDYRRSVRFRHEGKMKWGNFQADRGLNYSPTYQQFAALIVENTWRAWRTAGVTGGMLPWDVWSFAFQRTGDDTIKNSLPQPGQRGAWEAKTRASELHYLSPEGGWKIHPAGQALIRSNSATLAWIAGYNPDADAYKKLSGFADKAHSFRTGETVRKQVALLNDERTDQPFTYRWVATLGDREIASGQGSGTLAPAENKLALLQFPLPATAVPAGAAADGKITLTAKIGSHPHTDAFAFRAFGPMNPVSGVANLLVFDPAGHTKKMLALLGIKASAWTGKETPSAGTLLVIGREALSSRAKLPADLDAYVRAGGNVLVMTQSPDWFRGSVGARVSQYSSRRVFPVDAASPVVAGLNVEDLRDWRGTSTLVEARPVYSLEGYPMQGWRWGQNGVVATAAIEKPHRSGWRPLLECEFDLAYSPLMERDLGSGRITLCTLDFEDHALADPAADALLRRVISHAARPATNVPQAAKLAYLGNDAGEKLLKSLGVSFAKTDALPMDNTLVVIGSGANVTDEALAGYARGGGRVLVLGLPKVPEGGATHFGVNLTLAKDFSGSTEIPSWPEAAGLGVSDLRMRGEGDWRIIKPADGIELGAKGLLAKLADSGAGSLLWTQIDPTFLNADKNEWLRYTRWRQTRALSQLLANMGASFETDSRLFKPQLQRMDLSGPWKVKITRSLPDTTWDKPHEDTGITEAAKAASAPDFDDSSWDTFSLPAWYPPLNEQNGEYVFRRVIDIPAEWEGQVVQLGAGRVKSFDTVYWNGQPIGSTDKSTKGSWNLKRTYRVPGTLVKAGRAVIVVRGFAPDHQGGIHGRTDEMFLRVLSGEKAPAPFYNPDYREDFDNGDEPYRYYRW